MDPAATLFAFYEHLSYDPDTGVFRWREITTRRVRVGDEAGQVGKNGYRYIGLVGRRIYAHRLAWLVTHARWPKVNIDHINGDRLDNRIANLRECTQHENGFNRGVQKNNKSGLKGVHYDAKAHRWVAQTTFYKKNIFLGNFLTPEEAHQRYKTVTASLHGEFARSE